MVVINKADLNPANTEQIAAFCEERGVPMVGRLPYGEVVTEAMVAGQPVTAVGDNPVAQALRQMWAQIKETL